MVKARSKSLAFAAAVAAVGLGWLLVSQRQVTPAAILSPVPTEGSLRPVANPSVAAGRQRIHAGRAPVPDERWTVTFDLAGVSEGGAGHAAVEPPVIVILERGSLTWEQTITRRNEEGLFEMELEISHEDLRSSAVCCALDRVAADGRSGTALRLDRLSDRTRLGRCYASDGAWDLDERILGLGTVWVNGPAAAGSLSLGGAEFADLSVTVGFHRDGPLLTGSVGMLGGLTRADPRSTTGEAPMFGRAQFSISGVKDSIPFGTFGKARSWTVAAFSPDLEFASHHRRHDARGEEAADLTQRQAFGRDIGLPVSKEHVIDLWINLKSLPGAGVIFFRAEGVPAARTLSTVDLKRRVEDFSITTSTVSDRAAKWPSTIPLGNVRLSGAERYSVEVWSRPDTTNVTTLLHTEDLGNRTGHKKLVLQ